MKILLILQRRFAYIGHELAKNLKEVGIADEFCGYVQLRDSYKFLKLQDAVLYTELLLDEDIEKSARTEPLDMSYLEALERQYGPLWKYVDVDRVVRHGQLIREYPHDHSPYSHEQILRLVQSYAKHIEAFLDEQKPDMVFGYIFGSLGTLLLHDMARQRGIPILTTIVPSTRDLVTVSESYGRLTFVEGRFRENREKEPRQIEGYAEAKKFLEEFRNKPFVYSKVVVSRDPFTRMGQFAFLGPRKIWWTLYFNFFKIFFEWLRGSERRSDFSTVNPFLHLYDRLIRKMRNLRSPRNLYDPFEPSQPYAFFPLQYEPEMTLLLLAPEETDQIATIARVARSLPMGMLLYVKEHPGMVVFRPRAYYKRLKGIPNVRLIDPATSSFELIRHAKLVTTINGTPGWEAVLLQKPVITFGEVFYNALSFVANSRVPEELPALVRKQLAIIPDETELMAFLSALFADSASLDLMYLWELERDEGKRRAGFKKFARLLGEKIRLLQKRQ
jgi:hypothetical protein